MSENRRGPYSKFKMPSKKNSNYKNPKSFAKEEEIKRKKQDEQKKLLDSDEIQGNSDQSDEEKMSKSRPSKIARNQDLPKVIVPETPLKESRVKNYRNVVPKPKEDIQDFQDPNNQFNQGLGEEEEILNQMRDTGDDDEYEEINLDQLYENNPVFDQDQLQDEEEEEQEGSFGVEDNDDQSVFQDSQTQYSQKRSQIQDQQQEDSELQDISVSQSVCTPMKSSPFVYPTSQSQQSSGTCNSPISKVSNCTAVKSLEKSNSVKSNTIIPSTPNSKQTDSVKYSKNKIEDIKSKHSKSKSINHSVPKQQQQQTSNNTKKADTNTSKTDTKKTSNTNNSKPSKVLTQTSAKLIATVSNNPNNNSTINPKTIVLKKPSTTLETATIVKTDVPKSPTNSRFESKINVNNNHIEQIFTEIFDSMKKQVSSFDSLENFTRILKSKSMVQEMFKDFYEHTDSCYQSMMERLEEEIESQHRSQKERVSQGEARICVSCHKFQPEMALLDCKHTLCYKCMNKYQISIRVNPTVVLTVGCPGVPTDGPCNQISTISL